MNEYENFQSYDLITPDGYLTHLKLNGDSTAEGVVHIKNIAHSFVGFQIAKEFIVFNIKSTLAQLGIDGAATDIEIDAKQHCANINIKLTAFGSIAKAMLELLGVGAFIGKLFAADPTRKVRDPDYISRMFGRADRFGKPLLSLGGLQGSNDLVLDKINGRTVAFISLKNGCIKYAQSIYSFLPTLAKALIIDMPMRNLLRLHQEWNGAQKRLVDNNDILLVRTLPLHIRTVFARVVYDLLPHGYRHTSASVLQPDTAASGDVYELYGQSTQEISDIPLEFYTLEPYHEHVFFADRDQLQIDLENESTLFTAFDTAPQPESHRAAVFVVKGTQMRALSAKDWVARETHQQAFPGLLHSTRQALMIERYIEQQPCYYFLKKIDQGFITSQGVLLSRYFPSPLMKRMLLSDQVQNCLKGIYFLYPSYSHGNFFSSEDRSLLHDLDKFAIPVYWVDQSSKQILQYAQKPERNSGLFVPLKYVDRFYNSTIFGIYGSNLFASDFEELVHALMQGVLEISQTVNHPLLNKNIPLSLVTGGGPGAMEMGNRIAKELHILSCANIVDFSSKQAERFVNEQLQNSYIEAKMTYRLDQLVERQAEFNLDFPIFLPGGIGTDFEYALEEVRRKVGSVLITPILLVGSVDYWRQKITPRFKSNLESGTIKGSEWVSNSFYCIQTAAQGLEIYKRYFNGHLQIGQNGPVYADGFHHIE